MTERMVLRRLMASDAPLLFELDSDPLVMRHLTGRPTPLADIEQEIAALLAQVSQRRAPWGRGLATEGSRALVRRAFETGGFERVWGKTVAINTRSRRVMEKAGLRYVRTFHLEWDDPLPGFEHGEVEYALLRSEWLAEGPAEPGTDEIAQLSGGRQRPQRRRSLFRRAASISARAASRASRAGNWLESASARALTPSNRITS